MTNLHNRSSTVVWTLVFLCVIGGLQLYTSYPYDTDTAYHAAVGGLIAKYGLLHSFPWTTFSIMADRYADKELLFHLLFVPFSNLDFATAAKIVGTIGGTAVLLAIYSVLRIEGVRYAGVWALVPIIASAFFLYRIALVRPHLLSIALAVLLLWATVRIRLWIIVLIAVIYPWAYVAFWQIPLLILLAVETSRLLSGSKPRWKPAATVVAGLLIGVALHPNALNLLQLNWTQMSVLKNSWQMKEGFDLGAEFSRTSGIEWKVYLLPLAVMTSISVVVIICKKVKDTMLIAYTLAAIGFCILSTLTIRFTEYFAPCAVMSLALTSRIVPFKYLSQVALACSLLWFYLFGRPDLVRLARRGNDMPPVVAVQLQQLVPKDAQVFTPDWECTGVFMLALPGRRFIVALDPTFFYAKDPELYKIWYRVSREAPADTVDIIRNRFKSRYVLFHYLAFRDKFGALFNRLSTEPRVKTLMRTNGQVLFDLGDANDPH